MQLEWAVAHEHNSRGSSSSAHAPTILLIQAAAPGLSARGSRFLLGLVPAQMRPLLALSVQCDAVYFSLLRLHETYP